jgi:hypothetical protein
MCYAGETNSTCECKIHFKDHVINGKQKRFRNLFLFPPLPCASLLHHQGTSTLLIYLTNFAMGFIRTVLALVLMKPQDEHLSMFTIQTHLLNMQPCYHLLISTDKSPCYHREMSINARPL